MNNPKVSIIVPIYGVAQFVNKCARSLLSQTLKETEIIFVDDCSPDNSIDIVRAAIADFPGSEKKCTILSHESNRGLPTARNTGLDRASGDYIFHCDGDDWAEPDMVEALYSAAVENDSDIAWCDFFISFEHGERLMRARDYQTSDDLIRKGYLCGDMKYNVWNKLVKRSLYSENDIRFPDGHPMGEDMTMIKLAACSKQVTYVAKPLYHYLKTNTGAFTQSISEKKLKDIRENVSIVEKWLETHYPGVYTEDFNFFKLNVKLPFLLAEDAHQYVYWKEWYPESNSYVLRNKELPFRTKMLQWMAAHDLWFGVKFYNILLNKLVYGFLYK